MKLNFLFFHMRSPIEFIFLTRYFYAKHAGKRTILFSPACHLIYDIIQIFSKIVFHCCWSVDQQVHHKPQLTFAHRYTARGKPDSRLPFPNGSYNHRNWYSVFSVHTPDMRLVLPLSVPASGLFPDPVHERHLPIDMPDRRWTACKDTMNRLVSPAFVATPNDTVHQSICPEYCPEFYCQMSRNRTAFPFQIPMHRNLRFGSARFAVVPSGHLSSAPVFHMPR